MAKHARQPEYQPGGAARQRDTVRFPDDPGSRFSTVGTGAVRDPRRGTVADAGYPFPQRPASSYSHDAYAEWRNNGGRGPYAKRRRGAHPVARGVLVFLLVLVAACAGALIWYAHEFDSRVMANQSTPEAMADVLVPAAPGEPYYVLLLGSDWRENSGVGIRADQKGDNQRADVIVLARVDAGDNQVTLVSVPRDSRWEHDGTVSKINEAYNIGGAALETQAVSELVGVPIAHTVEIHFSGLMNMVDALGGVEIDVPQQVYYWDALTGEGVSVEAGRQRLTGQQAQIFARVRHDYAEQEGQRQSNVRQLVMAIADEIRSKPPLEWPGLGLELADCFGTDMRFLDFAGLLLGFGDGKITMYSGTGPNKGEIDESVGLWLCYDNPEGWRRLMDVVDAGGDPSTVDPNIEFEGRGTQNEEVEEGESVYVDEAPVEGPGEVLYEGYVDYDGEYYEVPDGGEIPVADETASLPPAEVPEEGAPEAAEDAGAVDAGAVETPASAAEDAGDSPGSDDAG